MYLSCKIDFQILPAVCFSVQTTETADCGVLCLPHWLPTKFTSGRITLLWFVYTEVKGNGSAPSQMRTVETSLDKESGGLPSSIPQSMLFLGCLTLGKSPDFLSLNLFICKTGIMILPRKSRWREGLKALKPPQTFPPNATVCSGNCSRMREAALGGGGNLREPSQRAQQVRYHPRGPFPPSSPGQTRLSPKCLHRHPAEVILQMPTGKHAHGLRKQDSRASTKMTGRFLMKWPPETTNLRIPSSPNGHSQRTQTKIVPAPSSGTSFRSLPPVTRQTF